MLNMKNENQLTKMNCERRHAFKQCFKTYYPTLLSKAVKLLKVPELAEDAVQDVFVQLWKSETELSAITCVEAFLVKCLKNRGLNILRGQKREILRYIEKKYSSPTKTENTEQTVLFNDIYGRVKSSIDGLSTARREVFEMKLEGASNKEIATHLDISENTVKVHYNRASKTIRKAVHE